MCCYQVPDTLHLLGESLDTPRSRRTGVKSAHIRWSGVGYWAGAMMLSTRTMEMVTQVLGRVAAGVRRRTAAHVDNGGDTRAASASDAHGEPSEIYAAAVA